MQVDSLDLTINNSSNSLTISSCDNYNWNGIDYTNSGTYTQTNGACTDTLFLTINSSNTGLDNIVACDNYTWINGVNYTVDNTSDTYTLSNIDGCDSIVSLNLDIVYSNAGTDSLTACDSLTWIDGITYYQDNNNAQYTLTNVDGCDSISSLHLKINYTDYSTSSLFACDSLTWVDGNTYYQSNNTALYTFTNQAGCDSIVSLDLQVGNFNTGIDVLFSCDSLTWINGITYYQSNNTAQDTLINSAGCDSIVTLDLTISNTLSSTDNQTICDSITWINGNTYYQTTSTVSDTLQTISGCDSIVYLNLQVNYSNTGVDSLTSCDSLTWIDGITYYQNNQQATYTIQNQFGCDSVVTLELEINYADQSFDTAYTCDNFFWNGQIFDSSGTYIDTLTTSNGCDSIIHLDLTINYTYEDTLDVTSCDTFYWENNNYTSSGMYAQTNPTYTSNGCDSIVTLNLTIISSTYSWDTLISCDSLTWMDGSTYYQSNSTAQYSLTNSVGCDSIITLDLTINNSIQTQDNITACDSASWNSNTYYTTGIYIDTLQTIHQCDSIVEMYMTINYSIQTQDNLVACDSASWNGNTYYTSGIYTDTLQTIHQCDSVIDMNLTINYSVTNQDTLQVCDSATWNGNNYYTTGIYTDTLLTVNQCDSIVDLHLTVNYSIQTQDSMIVCDSASWNGNTYFSSGIYTDTLQSIHQCDSIVDMLLTVNYTLNTQDTMEICDSASWNGNTYYSSGIYTDTLQTIDQCDSIIDMHLTIHYSIQTQDSMEVCDSANWNGNTYFVSGIYTDTLQTIHQCDSIVDMQVTVNLKYTDTLYTTQCDSFLWNNQVYHQSGFYVDSNINVFGCDSLELLDLSIYRSYLDTIIESTCDSFLWNGIYYDTTGFYPYTYTSINGCDSVVTLDLAVNDNEFSPVTFTLILDDYCRETYWELTDENDSIWYEGGDYNCYPSGGGSQANDTIITNFYLDTGICYLFKLEDLFGDGLNAGYWGGTDGSWKIETNNGEVLLNGSGDFGFLVDVYFYVIENTVGISNYGQHSQGSMEAFPNPFDYSTTIKFNHLKYPIEFDVYDISGRLIHKVDDIWNNSYELKTPELNTGIYWVVLKSQSGVKPLKLIVN